MAGAGLLAKSALHSLLFQPATNCASGEPLQPNAIPFAPSMSMWTGLFLSLHAPAVKARLAASRAWGLTGGVLAGGPLLEGAYNAPYRCRPATTRRNRQFKSLFTSQNLGLETGATLNAVPPHIGPFKSAEGCMQWLHACSRLRHRFLKAHDMEGMAFEEEKREARDGTTPASDIFGAWPTAAATPYSAERYCCSSASVSAGSSPRTFLHQQHNTSAGRVMLANG